MKDSNRASSNQACIRALTEHHFGFLIMTFDSTKVADFKNSPRERISSRDHSLSIFALKVWEK